MIKRGAFLAVCLLLLTCLLSGCFLTRPSEIQTDPVDPKPTAAAQSSTINITVVNNIEATIEEIYIDPSAQDTWGNDHLGSTSVLKANGSIQISLKKYEFENYDAKIIDSYGGVHAFRFLSLDDGSTVRFFSGDYDYIDAEVTRSNGATAIVTGTDDVSAASGGDPAEDIPYNYTAQPFSFTIYNESPYQINYVYIEPAYSDGEGAATDLLPGVLQTGESYTYSGQFHGGTDILDWRMYVVDLDGDVSSSYDVFNPWELSYVDIAWDNDSRGYICYFYNY